MPKEYTHWYLAERAREALPDATSRRAGSLRSVLSRNLELYLIGAVAPDLLYYAGRADASELEKAADAVHGSHGEDTFDGVRALVGDAVSLRGEESERELGATAALACGILTHIHADATFHPFVWYFSGDSIERHWIFETCMDLYVRRLHDLPNHGLMRRLLAAGSVDRSVLSRGLGRYFFRDASAATAAIIDAALSRHARLQRLFYSRLVAGAVRAAGLVSPGLRRFLGLSYAAQRGRSVGSFDGEMSYQHPVTCESHSTTFEALAVHAEASAAESIAALWRALDSDDPASEFSARRGPSLETGLTNGEPPTLTCSRPDRFDAFLPLLRRRSGI